MTMIITLRPAPVNVSVVNDTVRVILSGVGPQGIGIPAGGAAGEFLAKQSADDYDTGWVSIAEYAQDAVGGALADSATIDFTYDDTAGSITAIVKDGSLGTAKLGGDITTAGKALLDDADAAAQRATLGLGTLATQSGTFSGTSSGTNTGDQNLFSTIAVSGQSNVVADSVSDTLTLVAGSNITITTNASTDTITIAASGGGGGGAGDVVGPASAPDNAIATFDGTTGKLIQNGGATLTDGYLTIQQDATTGPLITLQNSDTADGSPVFQFLNSIAAQLFAVTDMGHVDMAQAVIGDVSGNTRGTDVIDLQTSRSSATQVASAANSAAIGQNNSVDGASSMLLGYGLNCATGGDNIMLIGRNFDATALDSIQMGVNALLLTMLENNIGIGTDAPASSAILDLTSTSRGFLAPRMTEAQRDAISSPAESLFIYNTDSGEFNFYDGAAWSAIGGGGGGSAWLLAGNTGTTAGTDFIGTTDDKDLVFKVNATEAMRILSTEGFLGIGTSTPNTFLNVVYSGSGDSFTVANFQNTGGSSSDRSVSVALTPRAGSAYITARNPDGNISAFDAELRFTTSDGGTPRTALVLNTTGTVTIPQHASATYLCTDGGGNISAGTAPILTVAGSSGDIQVNNGSGNLSAISAGTGVLTNNGSNSWSYTALATVATTGAYSDLSGLPTLGTLAGLNDADLTADVTGILPLANGGTNADNSGITPNRLIISTAPGGTTFLGSHVALNPGEPMVTDGNGLPTTVTPVADGTYTFDATTTGSVTSITFTKGIATAITTL